MKAKQKVELVVAQYTARARAMTRTADVLARMSDALGEDEAEKVYAELQRRGLIDLNGVIRPVESEDIPAVDNSSDTSRN